MRRVIVTEDMHRAEDLDAGRVNGNEDLALLAEGFGIGRGLDHDDHDLAARIARAGDVVFLAVHHPFAVFQLGGHGDVLGIRRGDIGFRHRKGGADFAGQQGFEPLLLLLGRSHAFQHFHVAGVRRGTVQRFGGEGVLAQFGGDIGVIEVRQPFAGFGIGQKEVPQPRLARLLLGAVQQFKLTRVVGPAVLVLLLQPVEFLCDRVHVFADMLDHRVQQGLVAL